MRFTCLRILLVPVVALLAGGIATACDNPVWEYAMLNWRQHAYHVYFLHEGGESMRDRAANRVLKREGDLETGRANLLFKRLDLRQINDETPEPLRELAARHAEGPLPTHVILTPRWEEAYVGRLGPRDARALIQSPARRELARTLTNGSNGVVLLLLGEDEAANEAVREQVKQAVAAAKEYEWQVQWLEVDRDAEEEEWLVRQLLIVRPGLAEITDPMVFGAFGQGHIEGPHVGAYTEANYLLDLIAFMNGPCTCMMNPLSSGLDLLTDWDWHGLTADWIPIAERRLEPGGFVEF